MAVYRYTEADILNYMRRNVQFRDLNARQQEQARRDFVHEFSRKPVWQQTQLIEGNHKYVIGSQSYLDRTIRPGGLAWFARGIPGFKEVVLLQPGHINTMHHEDYHRADHLQSHRQRGMFSDNPVHSQRMDQWLEWRRQQAGVSQMVVPGQGAIRADQLYNGARSLPRHLSLYGANPYELDKLKPSERKEIKRSMVREVVAEIGAKYNDLHARGVPANDIHATLGRTYPGIYQTFRELHDHTAAKAERIQNAALRHAEVMGRVPPGRNMPTPTHEELLQNARQRIQERGVERVIKETAKLEKKYPATPERPREQQPREQQRPERAPEAGRSPVHPPQRQTTAPGLRNIVWTHNPQSPYASADVSALVKAKLSPAQITAALSERGLHNVELYQRSNGAFQARVTADAGLQQFAQQHAGGFVRGNPSAHVLHRSPEHIAWDRSMDRGANAVPPRRPGIAAVIADQARRLLPGHRAPALSAAYASTPAAAPRAQTPLPHPADTIPRHAQTPRPGVRIAGHAGTHLGLGLSVASVIRSDPRSLEARASAAALVLSGANAAQNGVLGTTAKRAADKVIGGVAAKVVGRAGPIGTVLVAGARVAQGEEAGRVTASVAGSVAGGALVAAGTTAGAVAIASATGTTVAAGTAATTALVAAGLVAAGITAPAWVPVAIAGVAVTTVVAGGAWLFGSIAESIYDKIKGAPPAHQNDPPRETPPDPKPKTDEPAVATRYQAHPETIKLAQAATPAVTPAAPPVAQPAAKDQRPEPAKVATVRTPAAPARPATSMA